MSLLQRLPVLSVKEYLAVERQSELRHEFLDGLVYAMASEGSKHSTVCFNLAGIIGAQLIGTPCRGFSPNMKVRAGEKGLYAYPDLMVACGEPAFHDREKDVLLNPTVIFEVLSPSTEGYDRGEKFERYSANIETLQDYILVSQDRPRVEQRHREADGTWTSTELEGLSEVLSLPSINCRVSLADVYSRITFAEQ
jgi:Uma2 family endonuclease